MKCLFVIFTFLASCNERLLNLKEENLYLLKPDAKSFFPKIDFDRTKFESFPDISFEGVLKELDEPSLFNASEGGETIRLTALRTFQNHFTIQIHRLGNEIALTYKETYRYGKRLYADSTKIIFQESRFDTVNKRYYLIKETIDHGKTLLSDTAFSDKTFVDYENIKKKSSLSFTQWNNLVNGIDRNEFYKMKAVDGIHGDDGNNFLIETQSKNGYYLVYRWSPKDGKFKDLCDLIIRIKDSL